MGLNFQFMLLASSCVIFLVSSVQCDEIVINLHTSPSQSPPTPAYEVRRPHQSPPSQSQTPATRRGNSRERISASSSESQVSVVNSRGNYYGAGGENYHDDGFQYQSAPVSHAAAAGYAPVGAYGGQHQHQYQYQEYHQPQPVHVQHSRPQKYHPKQPYHLRPHEERVSHGHSQFGEDTYYSPTEYNEDGHGHGYGGYVAGSESEGEVVYDGGAGQDVGQSHSHGHGHTGPIPVPIAIHTEASSDHHQPEQHYYSSPVTVSEGQGVGWNWVKNIELGEFALLFIPAALLTLVYIFYVAANSPNNAHSKYFIDGVGSLGPPIPNHRRPSYPQPQPSYPQSQHGGGGGSIDSGPGAGGNGITQHELMQGGGPPPELANLLNQLNMPSHPSQFGASGPHSSPPYFGRSLALDRLTQRVYSGIEKGAALNKS